MQHTQLSMKPTNYSQNSQILTQLVIILISLVLPIYATKEASKEKTAKLKLANLNTWVK